MVLKMPALPGIGFQGLGLREIISCAAVLLDAQCMLAPTDVARAFRAFIMQLQAEMISPTDGGCC